MAAKVAISSWPSENASNEERRVAAIAAIVREIWDAARAGRQVKVSRIAARQASEHGLAAAPRLVDIIAAVPAAAKPQLLPMLRAKPIRTASGIFKSLHLSQIQFAYLNNLFISGIAVVAVMCKPHRCPHINMTGNICVYCPGGPDSDFEYSTQSYTGYEPTSMRAIRARYNPYLQTRHRVEQLKQLGHSVDKVEFIVMGGTFMCLPEDYRDYFIRFRNIYIYEIQ